jgi:hypothetical protein
MKEVVLTPSAQAELEGATEWYEVRAGGIGLKFVLCVDDALEQIGSSPSVFPRWEQDQRFRKFVLQRFPYIVFCRELDDRVEVIGSLAARENPATGATERSPPNVSALSSGRIRKREGGTWRRASPWYFTAGERKAVQVMTRRGRLSAMRSGMKRGCLESRASPRV